MRTLQLVFLNLFFYFTYLLFSAVYIPTLTVMVALASLFVSERSFNRIFHYSIRLYGRITTALPFPFIRVEYEDCSNSKIEKPYIFICNHRSMSDPFLLCVFPHEIVQVVNEWPFKIPVLGIYARMAGYLNIKAMEFEEFADKAKKLLNENVSLAFFPEGTRSGSKKMGHFHSGPFRLFLESKVSIIPVCISGNENIPPKGSIFLRGGTIKIRSLPPLCWEDFKNSNPFIVKNEVRNRIAKELMIMEMQNDRL